MIVTELDKIGIRLRQESLSELQRELLYEGLLAWHRSRHMDLALGRPLPGCFTLKQALAAVLSTLSDRALRAAKRAAAGRSIARLARRGLVEHCARGRWRLTPAGSEWPRRSIPRSSL